MRGLKGNMSQNLVLGLSYHFMSKNGYLFIYILNTFTIFFIKGTMTRIKILRHSSLHSNVFNIYM